MNAVAGHRRTGRGTRAGRHWIVGVLLVHIVIVASVGAVCAAALWSQDDAIIWTLSALLVGVTLWLFWSWHQVGRSAFDPYGMFLFAAVVFNGGQMFLEVLGLNPSGILEGHFRQETLVAAIALVVCALSCLHLGALVARAQYRESRAPGRAARQDERDALSCRIVGCGLLLVSFVPACVVLGGRLRTAYEAGYFALYQQEVDVGLAGAQNVLAALLVPGALFLLAGCARHKVVRAAALTIVGTYTMLHLFAGYRGSAAMSAMAFVWVWDRCVRRVRVLPLMLASAVALFVIFPLILQVRNVSGADRMSLTVLRDAYLSIDNPAVAILSEMGGSLITVAHTLELVPATRPYDYGLGYLYAMTSAFPNVLWDLHPMAAHGTPSEWLIWAVDPIIARMGGGIGFSFIAEAYLSFGWAGVPLVMFVIGYLFCKFLLWGDCPSQPSKVATVASFTSFTIAFARGEASFIFRPLLWYALAAYGACRLVGVLMSRNAPSRNRSRRLPNAPAPTTNPWDSSSLRPTSLRATSPRP